MKVNVSKNVIQGSFWGILWRIVTIIFPFIIRTIIIKKLGSDYSGLNSLFSSVLNVLNLADLGIGAAMVFAMYKPVANDDYDKISALLNLYRKAYLIIGAVVLGLGGATMPFLRFLISGDVPNDINIYILFLIYLLNSASTYFFFAYYNSILFAYQRQADSSKIQLFVYVFSYLIQIVFLLLFKNFYLYIIILPISTIAYNLLSCLYVRKKYPNIRPRGIVDASEKKEIKKNVISLFVFKIGSIVGNSIDSIIISSFLGLTIVSNYNNYYYILNAVSGVVLILFNSLTAGLGNKLVYNSEDQNAKEFSLILSINALIVVLCTNCMFGLYQDFISFWLGEEFLLDYGLMICFCIYFFVHLIRKTCVTYRDAAGMWRDTMLMPLVSASINLTLDILLVKAIGLYGIIVATIFCMFFIELPWEAVLLLKKKIKYPAWKYFTRVLIYCFVSIVSCKVCLSFLEMVSIKNIYLRMVSDLAISFTSGFVLYSLLTIFEENNVFKILSFLLLRFIPKKVK